MLLYERCNRYYAFCARCAQNEHTKGLSYLPVFKLEPGGRLTDFVKIWNGRYAIGSCPKLVFFNFMQSVIKNGVSTNLWGGNDISDTQYRFLVWCMVTDVRKKTFITKFICIGKIFLKYLVVVHNIFSLACVLYESLYLLHLHNSETANSKEITECFVLAEHNFIPTTSFV